jgi:hypothetical protein
MSDLDRLRAELKKKRQAVTNKINRVKKSTGAVVAGTELDPRRKVGAEKSYNKRQLETHIEQLNDFMRRGNQFVALKGGAPATKGEAYVYERRKAAQQEAKASYEAVMSKIDTPSGFTALQNVQNTVQGPNQTVRGPYSMKVSELSEITSRTALQKLSESLVSQIKPNYLNKAIGSGRDNLNTALKLMGMEEEVTRLDALTDHQFDAFWFGTNIAESVFMKYHTEQDRVANPTKKETWQEVEARENVEELGNYISWAGTVSPERPIPNAEPSQRIKGITR